MLLLRNAEVFTGGRFVAADLTIAGELVHAIGGPPPPDADVVDLAGCRLVPGFVDLHFHGAMGADVMDDDPAGLARICDYQARHGTTAFLATTITADMPALLAAVERIATAAAAPGAGARVVGLHIEGPFINPAQRGCHRVDWMKSPSLADHDALSAHAAGAPLHFTVAPELPGAAEFIRGVVARGSTVSLGHSDARAAEVRRGLDAGAGIFTHLFNAMRGLHHREPGVVGAALDSPAHVELICDGVHVAPEVVKLVYQLKGPGRLVLVTDAMAAAGMGDGTYRFAGERVTVTGGVARTDAGALASSTITLRDALANLMRFTGAPLAEALSTVTSTPARVLGMEDRLGAIAPGRAADLVALDGDLAIRAVFCRGRRVT
ncbi:MAG TPA: N-acetylglucosamine-6-phosphate deacetylase [Kofleriaceae bacterium]|nr:N-acetylglucosamine-6-phosphate deacetylase [Kofleriaceae bacterium]